MSRLHLVAFGDQALFSACNFLFSIGLVRVFGETAFAGYGIGLSIALLAQAVQRGFNIQTSLLSHRRFASRARALLGAHLILVGGALAAGLLAYLAIRIAGGGALLRASAAATVLCIAIFFQMDANRLFLVKRDCQIVSVAVTLLIGTGYLGMLALGRTGVASFEILALCLAAVILAISAGLVWRGIVPRFGRGLRMLAASFRLVMGWTTLGTVGSAGYVHLPLFVLGAIQPPIAAAAFVAARSLLQPLQVVLRSLDIADKHLFAIHHEADDRRGVRRAAVRNVAVSAVLAVPTALLAEWVLPLVYGRAFGGYGYVLGFWAATFILMAPILPFETLIYAEQRNRIYALGMVAIGAVCAISVYPAVTAFGLAGALATALVGVGLQTGLAAAVIARHGPDVTRRDEGGHAA